MITKYVCFLPPFTHPSNADVTATRDMQFLNITLKDVISAVILDWYEDTTNNISALYQIAYDNFYTHNPSNVPFTEDGVGDYIHQLNNDVLYFLSPYYDEMLSRSKPSWVRSTDLPDQSLCIEYLYNG